MIRGGVEGWPRSRRDGRAAAQVRLAQVRQGAVEELEERRPQREHVDRREEARDERDRELHRQRLGLHQSGLAPATTRGSPPADAGSRPARSRCSRPGSATTRRSSRTGGLRRAAEAAEALDTRDAGEASRPGTRAARLRERAVHVLRLEDLRDAPRRCPCRRARASPSSSRVTGRSLSTESTIFCRSFYGRTAPGITVNAPKVTHGTRREHAPA